MNAALAILRAVAEELANEAKANLVIANPDEQIVREWYENGFYYRETISSGAKMLYCYDFRLKKSSCKAVESR